MKRPRFTLADAQYAFDTWGANCGPGAIAAIAMLTLDEVRPYMGDFESKRYTNPTLMFETLDRLHAAGVCKWHGAERHWPIYGLVRIQWEGPWTRPGVPMRARYRHTHWVGAAIVKREIGVFDINCMNNGSGWSTLQNWSSIVVPWLINECVPGGDGNWHITHAIEVDLPGVAA
ncbi:hypothetical protein [Bradyrhizobium sp. SZCCHNR2032]|uniref:hypothetical protein n=1 Tax=Bradyrhizobium sp. SZCCHNR2032 TaxID=3057384 RepID=UPI00291608C7|nr:hypothetical protein [Bradyrhizobium sp. SZCCHNR2032]